MTVALIVIIWILSSILLLMIAIPILRAGKAADEVMEEYWGEPDHFDERV